MPDKSSRRFKKALTIWSREVPHEKIVDECIEALHSWLCGDGAASATKGTSDTMGATR